jgi:plasmid stability protein
MATITLKGLPGDVHEAFKARARMHGRSLNREMIRTLEEAVRSHPADTGAVLRQARTVRESVAVHLTQRDLDAFKKQGRQ